MEVGIALAGGAVPKFASIGVLQALEEENIKISHIAGTSAGSIVAALYAYGYPLKDIKMDLMSINKSHIDFNWRNILRKFFRRTKYFDGFVKGQKLEDIIFTITGNDTFSSFKLPCAIVATDLKSKKPIIFTQEKLPSYHTESNITINKAVRASCSIPIMYQPVRWEEYILVDGGLVQNCPVEVVRELGAETVISIDPISTFKKDEHFDTISPLLNCSMMLMLETQMKQDHEKADLNIYPEVGDIGLFEFKRIEECINKGYQYTKGQMKEIKEKLTRLKT
ncbi:NTE family protein [Salirhabdus euzebyi]|uniref:NTE family protein n=1 Tax=Salirhabdus euzebyi TaxID=394506 RepID=A0A841Q8L9_9BACI|nr:patatin-like phospholipase family protein [Salirhabdus euzebyi]MBB6454750.1 NTE family protein [Salirhabdus euzebyi]